MSGVRLRSGLAAALAGALACAGVGGSPATETGMLRARWTPAGGEPQEVPFSFDAEGDSTGFLFTTLGPGGEAFRGRYVLLQDATDGKLVTEISDGWSAPEWNVWEKTPDGGWVAEAASTGDFARFYTGRAVAYLQGDRGHAMRCRFTLARPDEGFLAGGTGECQTSDGGWLALAYAPDGAP